MSGSAAKQQWARLAPREKALVAGAAALVCLALTWWLLLAPPLTILRNAEQQHRILDTQLQRMRAWQAQARSVQSQPRQTPEEASRLLEATVRQQLGLTARMSVAGDRVTVALTGASPEALSQWLTQSRTNARVLPAEARLVRNASGLWDGTVVLALPSR